MNKLQQFIQSKPCGFLKSSDLPELIKLDRLFPVLVRCGACRFTCAAQDVDHLLKCIDAGGDYVRDVSLPVGSFETAAKWVQAETLAKVQFRAEQTKAANLLGTIPDHRHHIPPFNEAECGGAFDGFTVTSDADPGL